MKKRNPQRAFALAIFSSDHLMEKEHYVAAASILERYLNLHPPHASVLRRLGRIRMMQGRPADAVPLLSAALQLERPVREAVAVA